MPLRYQLVARARLVALFRTIRAVSARALFLVTCGGCFAFIWRVSVPNTIVGGTHGGRFLERVGALGLGSFGQVWKHDEREREKKRVAGMLFYLHHEGGPLMPAQLGRRRPVIGGDFELGERV